jgi:hypothetical protein
VLGIETQFTGLFQKGIKEFEGWLHFSGMTFSLSVKFIKIYYRALCCDEFTVLTEGKWAK